MISSTLRAMIADVLDEIRCECVVAVSSLLEEGQGTNKQSTIYNLSGITNFYIDLMEEAEDLLRRADGEETLDD